VPTVIGQSSLSSEAETTEPDTPFKSELAMSRIILLSSFAALLTASGTQSANATQSANQSAWAQESLACADVGIDPGSIVFNQCVADLHNSLWALENLYEN
jgi:hypothetical protein